MKVLSPESALRKKLAQLEDVKPVYGTLIGIDKEAGTDRGNGTGPGRGIIYVKSMSTHPRWNPQGQEYSRSDLLSNGAARDLMQSAKNLIGHRVLATVLVIVTDGGKVRELALLEDLGADKDYDPNNPAYQPDYDYLFRQLPADKKQDTFSRLASHGAR
ncbi:MAG: hypothetical protein B7X32_03635 [Microbacterium sp. 13-71-7]|jgi:hypothetical protein|nr:MAG: hypothetical protein B7X32_03635 [Microbacterium sp. 13-71-7]